MKKIYDNVVFVIFKVDLESSKRINSIKKEEKNKWNSVKD